MKKPILLTKKKMIAPIIQTLERIEKIRLLKVSNDDPIILEGLFILAISSFETCLTDTLRVFLIHIPYKLDKVENINKDVLIEGNVLEKAIDAKLNSISYKNLTENLDYFVKMTDLPNDTITSSLKDQLLEIKASRNLLMHNNLIVNDIYEESSGVMKRRPEGSGNRLSINQNYLFLSIQTLTTILNRVKQNLETKYNEFTHLRALRELWKYSFSTPIMNFDDEWISDENEDSIFAHNSEKSRRGSLSSGESTIYNIWYSHLINNAALNGTANFLSLDKGNREKAMYLLSVIDIFKT